MRLVRLAALASSLALAAGFVVFGASGTALASCSGWGCDGLDPVAQGCSVASTVTSPASYNGTALATLQNRYSSGCNSNWARAELTTAGLNAHDSFVIDIFTTDSRFDNEYMCYPVVSSENGKGYIQETCSGATISSGGFWYSDMVDGTNNTTAHVDVYDRNGNFLTEAYASQ